MYEEASDSESSHRNKPSPKKLKFPPPGNSMDRKVIKLPTKAHDNNPIQKSTKNTITPSEVKVKAHVQRKPKIKQSKVSSKSKTPVHKNDNCIDLPTLQLMRSMEKECFDLAKKKNQENPNPQIAKASREWKELFKNRNTNSCSQK